MPRPNQPRSIASEQALARRIAHERDARGMSYEGLASRMTSVGCAINASAIYKIEKSDPPRRITVDELVAFGKVFETPLERLLLPPELVLADELTDLVVAWDQARNEAIAAKEKEVAAWDGLRSWVDAHPEHLEQVESALRDWTENYYEDKHEFHAALRMGDLTGAPEWFEAASAALRRRSAES